MAAYATVGQYQARFGTVSDTAMLTECLEDASAAIRLALDRAGIDRSDPSEDLADRMMRTCRSVANRLMPEDGPAMQGVTQMGVTAGSYSEQYTFSASYGTPKLLASELDMLGIGPGRAGWLPLAGDGDD